MEITQPLKIAAEVRNKLQRFATILDLLSDKRDVTNSFINDAKEDLEAVLKLLSVIETKK